MCIRDRYKCINKGESCSKAHSTIDFRNITEILKKVKVNEDFEIESQAIISKETSAFNLEMYRTMPCPSGAKCTRTRCLCYHDLSERRRNVKDIQYSNKVCKSMVKGNKYLDPKMCKLKDKCEWCHTKSELYYHPLNYKKRPCKKKKCEDKEFCPNRHKSDYPPKKPKIEEMGDESIMEASAKKAMKMGAFINSDKCLEDLKETNRSLVNVLVFLVSECRTKLKNSKTTPSSGNAIAATS
eukprot:TRINITY_DN8013_c0_g1_i4.p1 TRINITY_DN8013_c0_g1~~TRINITY_DN8013_c0_g1_i4.p1  ORF type:complete len:240 (+),score=49.29 TRINITY_DN8013_c0_g1_i4:70-789(+)